MDFSCKSYKGPLLPYEKQIIEIAGCSEEEYRRFVFYAAQKAVVRPAEYANIPDIACTGTEWAIGLAIASLVLGVASSVAAFLLMPKPKAPAAGDSVTQTQLENLTGGNRFIPTYGFDSQAELANFGDPVPVIFGRYTGTSGGMLISPKLVWSRMFSYGTQQGVKLMFVVGEQGVDAGQAPQGIARPDLAGIFLGNGSLDAIYSDTFAFYWKRNTTVSGYSRIRAANLAPGFGTRGSLSSGDPENNDDIFACPTKRQLVDYGFSSAHALSNSAEFGCYAAIPNGTPYRVNWRVVSIPALLNQRDDPGEVSTYERIKIAGDDNGLNLRGVDDGGTFPDVRSLGMKGIGRNYSRRMGLVEHNGQTVSSAMGTEERYVNVNDEAIFIISSKRLAEDFYPRPTVKINDINSNIDEQCTAADDALQIGELFMIGRTTWQVTKRKLGIWSPEDNKGDQVITLKCIDVSTDNRVGFVAKEMLTQDVLWDTAANQYNAGAAFFPLMRVSFGLVRNTRPCEVTEIGLRSKVFQKLNGLCNFQSIPTPGELIEADGSKVTIVSGTANIFIKRSSAFSIFVRPAGLDPAGQPFVWHEIKQNFVVVGNQPIDQYNFIRINHPEKRQYEFKFVPKNGADVGRHTTDNTIFWQLSAGASVDNTAERNTLSSSYLTQYGTFVLTAVGSEVKKTQIQQNIEFTSKPVPGSRSTIRTYPEIVSVNSFIPAEDTSGVIVTSSAVEGEDTQRWYTEPGSSFTEGRNGSFAYELFGSADSSSLPNEAIATKIVRHNIGNRYVEINYRYQKASLPAGHFSGQSYSWNILERTVHSSSSNWAGYDTFNTTVSTSGGNPFRNTSNGTITAIGERHRITATASSPQGRQQGYYEELFGPARNYDYGYSATATINYTLGGKSIRIFIDGIVENIPNHWSGLSKFWGIRNVRVFQESSGTTTNWNIGDKFSQILTVGANNPFRTPGTSVGAEYIVVSMKQSTIDDGLFTADRIFENQSQYADISFYGSLVEKSNNSNPEHIITYVNEITSNAVEPQYSLMTTCGLALKASRNFSRIDQLRVWLAEGIPVKRFHPDESATVAPSNLFCDLVYYLLTDKVAGVGSVLNMSIDNPSLINTDDFIVTAKFLKTNEIYFNGAITKPANIRQFISETAPFMLCNSVIADGKFSLQPALPTTSTGEISTNPVVIKQLFTAGNILEDTFEIEYLPAEERRDFQAVIRYRQETKNQLPQEKNIILRWAEPGSQDYSVESFDLTAFCTTRQHAELVGRFFLSIRRRVTHTVKFKTTPFGISLAPGDYIRVLTESNPYSSARNGTIDADGAIVSASNIVDGQYSIIYHKIGSEDVNNGTMTVSGGIVSDSALWNSLFTISDSTISKNVYQVEQLSLGDDNTVEITASEFPCDDSLVSRLALDVTNADNFSVDL